MAPHDINTVTANANANANSLSKSMSLPRRAYVTFLAGNGDYLKGVVGLAKGLRKSKSKYPLVVAILPDVPEEHRKILIDQGCVVREIEPVYPPENSPPFAMAYYVINYAKIRIWEFVEYSKMIYLVGDIMVFENIDHLFDLPDDYFYAVADCCCDKTWITPQLKISYCEHNWPAEFDHLSVADCCCDKTWITPQLKISYCEHNWPAEFDHLSVADCCCDKTWITPQLKIGYCEHNCPAKFRPSKPALYFNAGMFVFQPCTQTYHRLLNKIPPTTPFAEQDFLNKFFSGIYKPIPPIYNLGLAMLLQHPDIELEKAKVVHYCAAGSKPWNMQREEIKMLIQKWSDIYNDESLDYKNYSAVVASEEAAGNEVGEDGDAAVLQPFLVGFSEAGEVPYFSAPSAA